MTVFAVASKIKNSHSGSLRPKARAFLHAIFYVLVLPFLAVTCQMFHHGNFLSHLKCTQHLLGPSGCIFSQHVPLPLLPTSQLSCQKSSISSLCLIPAHSNPLSHQSVLPKLFVSPPSLHLNNDDNNDTQKQLPLQLPTHFQSSLHLHSVKTCRLPNTIKLTIFRLCLSTLMLCFPPHVQMSWWFRG